MRAVLDTNVLVSSAIASRGTLRNIVDAWFARRFEVLISADIVVELERTLLTNAYFVRLLPDRERRAFLADVRARSVLIAVTTTVSGVATHPEDDRVLATAVSGAADYLVTGDKQLQKLGSYQGVTIMSPTDFSALLDTLP